MSETQRIVYTKEELAERVKVSPVVEHDLKTIITDRLEQCGLYFRVFSRVKTPGSMARKFGQKCYGGERKLQDLVGVRINLYFDDDVGICQHIMEQTFDVLEWSASERNDDEFKPIKLNGVFRLPEYLKSEVSEDTWEMCIDDTFEIQIKTMYFEGWHEIEHDMRYKGEELWSHYPGFSRNLNSILATLELCDKSTITLFEDLGHTLYKAGRWSDMIKSHFRIKMSDATMYPEVKELLDEDLENVDNLAKRIYKMDRVVLIDCLLKRMRRVPINVNTIIALLNDSEFHDSRLSAIFRKRDVYNDGVEESLAESRHYELRPLKRHTAFQMCTEVDGSRMKTEENPDAEKIFSAAVQEIYQWVRRKYGSLFKDMPPEPATYHADILAYHVAVHLNSEEGRMNMHVRHMDPDVGGRLWYSEANLEITEKRTVYLKLSNGYAQAERDDRPEPVKATFFSYPGYYKSIVDTVGIRSGLSCSNRRRILRREQLPSIEKALLDSDRKFPVVLIVSRADEDGMLDEDWLGQFRVSDFTRTVWRYAHVLCAYEDTGRILVRDMMRDEHFRFFSDEVRRIPRLYIFWPDGKVDDYDPDDVKNCSFGRHLELHSDARTYDIVRGGQAFYHRIVTDLRDWNVTADMWAGFELEIKTEIPQ